MTSLLRLVRAGVLLAPLMVSASVPLLNGCGGGGDGCCKVCSEGKACGDSCIAADQTCNTVGGCACNK
jgi:hypothetical protein